MPTLNKFEKFDDYIKNKNFRPLVMSQSQIFDILRNSSFDKMGFYAVNFKTLNLAKNVLTLRYVLFNRPIATNPAIPYNFDGQPTTLASVSRHLKFRGFKIDDLGNTSYVFDRTRLHEIFNTTDSTIPSQGDDKIFVVFMLIDKTPTAPAPPPFLLNIDLEYEVIETWKSGGGGPGSTATSPAP